MFLFAQLGDFRCFSNRAPEIEREKRENFHFDWNPIAQKTFRRAFLEMVLSLLMVRSFFFFTSLVNGSEYGNFTWTQNKKSQQQ